MLDSKRPALALFSLACTAACMERPTAVLSPHVSRSIDDTVHVGGTAHVDLLLVIDNSQSMTEEQQSLEREIPLLVEELVRPPDENGDGEADWNPVESLRVAVVTTDLGTNGVVARIPGCEGQGDAGMLRTDPACGETEPILSWQTGEDAAAFATTVGCVARAGIAGCGFEQQLGAAAQALAGGFAREDALLAVLVLTDEEDCSLANAPAFYGSIADYSTINVECTRRLDALATIDDLAARLSLGRDSGRFVFAALAGIPVELAGASAAEILASPKMAYIEEPTGSESGPTVALRPVCIDYDAAGAISGRAMPGRRIVELASRFEDGVVRSICEESFRPAVAELTRKIGARLAGACLGRALVPGEDGRVDCTVREALPVGGRCADLPARAAVDFQEGREVCQIAQDPTGVNGWYYDVGGEQQCDRLAFAEHARPDLGSTVRFSCLVEVTQIESDLPRVGL